MPTIERSIPDAFCDFSRKRGDRSNHQARPRRRKKNISSGVIGILSAFSFCAGGCGLLRDVVPAGPHDTHASFHDDYGLNISYPEVEAIASDDRDETVAVLQPFSFEDPATLPTLELSLHEAVRQALTNRPVLRRAGSTFNARVTPQAVTTRFDPGLTAASMQGTEAALSAFDAQYRQQLSWSKSDTPRNQQQAFGQPSVLDADSAIFNGELSKTTATGASFALRHVANYRRSNQGVGDGFDFRLFPSAFTGWLEAEWRQPLMQGAGTNFNRIAGPNARVGQYNGVLIARINEDVSLADFETGVIQTVADVEQAYWNLVTAYRLLDTIVKAREAALQTWQIQKARLEVGTGRADDEAQARSQYYQFDAQVKNALAGQGGLYESEQQLRYLVGLAATDGSLIKPTTEPTDARVIFDWDSALAQALQRRVEIRQQKMQVQRRELELTAAKLNFQPRLDFLGQYRYQGIGDHLVPGFYENMFDGNYQEWQAGIELSYPVGFRAAGSAVAHAKLSLRRERAVLDQTEYQVSHLLSNAARDVETRHELMETNYNRLQSDLNQVDVLRIRYEQGSDSINFLLQAQRQVVNSASDFYRSLADYNLAIRNFHREKGSLLAYNQIKLSEGEWEKGAYRSAHQVGRYLTPRKNADAVTVPQGSLSQPFDPSEVQSTIPESNTGDQSGVVGDRDFVQKVEEVAVSPLP